MKKLFTLLAVSAFLSFSPVVKAQLVFHNPVTHVTSSDPGALLEAYATIVNTSESAVTVKLVRTNTSLSSGHESYYCLGANCYLPSTYTTTFSLAATDSVPLLAYADPHGTYGTDMVNYKVFDMADSVNNRILVDFTYDFVSGINVLHATYSYMVCTQSNTEDMTSISYSINNFKDGKVVVRNLLGSVVKEIGLTDKQGVLSVSTAEFPSGIYMYFLYNNEEPLASKKMVISHR